MPDRDGKHRFLAFNFGYSSTLLLAILSILGESLGSSDEEFTDYVLDHLSVVSASFRAFGMDLLGGWEADFVDEFRKRLVAGEGDWMEGRLEALDRTIRTTRWVLYLEMDPEERALFTLGSGVAKASLAFMAGLTEEADEMLRDTAEELVESARRVNLPEEALRDVERLAHMLTVAPSEGGEDPGDLTGAAAMVFGEIFAWLSRAQSECG